MESDAGLATSPKPYINSFTMYIVNHAFNHVNYIPLQSFENIPLRTAFLLPGP